MPETKPAPAVILWVIAAAQFLTPFMFSAIGVALPTIGREFSAGAVQLGMIEMVYVLAVALLLLPIGRFADIHGRRRIFLSGIVLLTLATLVLGTTSTITLLIVFRFVQGMGAAMITSTSFAILTSVSPPEKRGRAMGVVVACVYLGISAGPILAGLMIDYLGWRWIFYSAVPVEALILLFAATVGLAAAAAITATTSFAYIFLVLVVRGLGFSLFSTPNTTAIMASIDRRDYGMAASLIATMRTTGMLTAMTLITLLLSWFLGKKAVTLETGPLFLTAMHRAMVIFCLLGCAGILCSLGRTKSGIKRLP